MVSPRIITWIVFTEPSCHGFNLICSFFKTEYLQDCNFLFVFVSASAIWCAETPTCFDASLTEVDVSKM